MQCEPMREGRNHTVAVGVYVTSRELSGATRNAARALLTDFLKKRRAGLKPADVGLPADSSRRRTPGLRRSEVAQLAGVSTEWYTLFETGRERAMTSRAIESGVPSAGEIGFAYMSRTSYSGLT